MTRTQHLNSPEKGLFQKKVCGGGVYSPIVIFTVYIKSAFFNINVMLKFTKNNVTVIL